MSAPGAAGRRSAAVRLAGIGLLAAGVTAALYAAGRLHTPDYTFGLFGRTGLGAIAFKSVLASVALGLAVLQVLLALWIYRKLPLAGGPPRPVRLAHRGIGFGLFALTVPIAVHCLLAYGVQLTSVRVAVHSLAGCFFYGAFAAKVLLVHSRRLPGWGAAGGRGYARRRGRRALVHLRAVVLQRLLATRAIGTQISQVSPARVSRRADRAWHPPAGLQEGAVAERVVREG